MPDNTRRARDEHFWKTFADRYAVEPGPINLENGYFGRMSRTVVEEYQRNIELINRSNSVHVRQRFEQVENLEIRAKLASLIDVPAETVALNPQRFGWPSVADPQLQSPSTGRSGADLRSGVRHGQRRNALAGAAPWRGSD